MLKYLFCFYVTSATSVALATGPYYLEDSSDAKSSGWSNAYYWINASGTRSGDRGASLDPTADYVVTTTTGLNTPSTESVDCYFGGKSLTLSGSGRLFVLTRNSARLVFPAGGLILDSSEGSKFQAVDGSVYTLSGNIVVRGEDYVFSSEKNGQTFVLDGSLQGNGRLRFAKNAATVKLTSDLSAFSGTVALWVADSRLELARDMMQGGVFFNNSGTLALSNKVSVGNLTMPANSTIEIGGWYRRDDATGAVTESETGCLEVTGSLLLAKPTRILVKDGAHVPNTMRIPILTVPSNQDLDDADFSLEAPSFENPRLVVDADSVNGTKTMYLTYAPKMEPIDVSTDVTLDSLELLPDAKLEFGGKGVKTEGVLTGWIPGRLTVNGTLVAGGRVNIVVREDALVPVFPGENPETMSITLIRMPASSTLELDAISLSAEAFPSAELSILTDEVDGTKSVVLNYEPTVVMTATDSNSQNFDVSLLSSLTQKDHWSNAKTPTPEFHYLVRTAGVDSAGCDLLGEHSIFLRTPGGTEKGAYCQTLFQGKSLVLGRGCCLTLMDTSINFNEGCVLRFLDGSAIRNGQGMSPHVVGAVEMPSGAVTVGTWGKCFLHFDRSLSGNARILCRGAISATSSPGGTTKFKCDLSRFSGTLEVDQYRRADYGFLDVEFECSGYALSDLPQFDPGSVSLKTQAKLIVSEDVVLSKESNRGFKVGDSSGVTVYVENGKTLEIGTRVTVEDNGWLVKNGGGVLELGGDVRFGQNGSEEPTEGKAYALQVSAGVLQVSGAEACNGLSLSFDVGASLVLKYNPQDEELVNYGIRNLKSSTPFVLPDGMTVLPLTVLLPVELPKVEHRVALVTVSSKAAESVRGMLAGVVVGRAGFAGKLWEKTDEDGNVTFGCTLTPIGMTIVIR